MLRFSFLALLPLAVAVFGASGPNDSAIGPDYTPATEMTAKAGVPKGTIKEFTMLSTESPAYPGIAKNKPGEVVPYKRKVQVYIPAQYVAGQPVRLLLVTDGPWYTKRVATALDNLIAAKRVPVQVAVMVESGGGDSKGSQRGLEYDTLSGKYAEFIEAEVLPRVTKETGVVFTKKPDERAAMGGSSGAAAALTMAWYHPDLYRRVLSYSGTFVDQQYPTDPKTPHGAWEYHEHLIAKTDKKPLRLWLQVGEKDNGWDRDEASLHNWVMANERMAAVLAQKGYAYQYIFCKKAGHVDGKAVAATLPSALEWIWK
ncbi:ferric enterobactin esterase [Verrucomicrobiota bacterium]|nr:ferric enterobactin esterase [Verrucomicrobiota bacterium]